MGGKWTPGEPPPWFGHAGIFAESGLQEMYATARTNVQLLVVAADAVIDMVDSFAGVEEMDDNFMKAVKGKSEQAVAKHWCHTVHGPSRPIQTSLVTRMSTYEAFDRGVQRVNKARRLLFHFGSEKVEPQHELRDSSSNVTTYLSAEGLPPDKPNANPDPPPERLL